jgi:hypothetical protein
MGPRILLADDHHEMLEKVASLLEGELAWNISDEVRKILDDVALQITESILFARPLTGEC